MKTYKVGTFWHPELRPSYRALAYLRDFHPSWTGCIVYEVEAKNGPEAKRKACALRRAHEDVKATR